MSSIFLDVFWRDHGAARGVKDLGDNAQKSTQHVKTLGDHGKTLIAGFAGFAAAEIFHSFISGARESNAISRITEERIRSTGGAAHVTADQVGDLATAISNKTGADDEAIQTGENMLLTFTGIRNEVGKGNNVFDQATAAVTDLAAGLNHGEVSAQGTQQAATLLGKALNDPIAGMTALRRVGISFTASQVAQITALQKSGKTLEAQKIILAEVNREFGGTAKAAADPLQRMSVILGNVGEDLGNKVLPALNDAADVMGAIPGPVYVAAGSFIALGAGAIGVAKGVNAVRDVAQGAAGLMRVLGIRTAETAAAETVQAAAARSSAVSTAASGDAAAAAGVKFGTLAARVGVVAGVIGAIQGAKFVSEMTAGTVATDKLGASLTRVGQVGDSVEFRHLFARAGIGNFTVDAQSAAEAMDNFASEAETAFGQGFTQKAERLLSFGAASAGAAADIGKLDQGLAQMVRGGRVGDADKSFAALADRLRKMGFAQAEITAMFPQYIAAQHAAAAAADAASKANARTNDVLVGTKSNANIASTALHALAVAGGAVTLSEHGQHAAHLAVLKDLSTLADRTLTLRGADRDLAAAKDDLSASLRQNGRGMSDNTVKGRANAAALDAVASKTLASLAAHHASEPGLRIYAQRVEAARNALISEAQRAGMSTAAARKYANAILAVPRKETTAYLTPGLPQARAGARGLASDISRINGRTVTVRYQADGRVLIQARGTTAIARKTGGPVTGPGGPTDDLVPAWLSNGEFVVNAAAARRHGALLHALNAQRYAAGGRVTSRYVGSFAPANIMSSFIDRWAAGWATSGGGGAMGNIAGSGVRRWAPVILRALAILGQSSRWLGTVENRMQRESGGNPTIVNKWDSNWRAGTPSVGLMQVIGPTFRAYAGAFRTNPPFLYGVSTNPLANTYAGLNYALHRYGSLAALSRPGGYGSGTSSAAPGWAWVGEHGPELVKFRGGERVLPARGGGAAEVNITVQLTGHAIGFQDQVMDAVRGAVRSGRMSRAVLP